MSQLFGGSLFVSSGARCDRRPVQKTRISSPHKDPQGKISFVLFCPGEMVPASG